MRLACSQCGADVEIGPVDRFIECLHCASSLLVLDGRTFQPVRVDPLLKPAQAGEAVDRTARVALVTGF